MNFFKEKNEVNGMSWFFWLNYLIFFLGFLLVILKMPFWFNNVLSYQEFLKRGEIGDFIGGTSAPIIGFFTIIVTFLAFWIQYQANQRQREDIHIERFENKFYEMLKLHKDNVNEIEIGGKYRGRKAFVRMYYEYRYIYMHLDLVLKNIDRCVNEYDLTKISYQLFFFGVNPITGEPHQIFYDKRLDLVSNVSVEELHAIQEKFLRRKRTSDKPFIHNSIKGAEFELNVLPFNGQIPNLAHYFRHLYQMVKFVAESKELDKSGKNIKGEIDDRKKYMKLIRAQLSNHEQALLYWNSLWISKDVWWVDKKVEEKKNEKGFDVSYILDYKLIKNIPYNLTEGLGPDPINEVFKRLMNRGYSIDNHKVAKELFDKLNDLFEWEVNEKKFNELSGINLSEMKQS